MAEEASNYSTATMMMQSGMNLTAHLDQKSQPSSCPHRSLFSARNAGLFFSEMRYLPHFATSESQIRLSAADSEPSPRPTVASSKVSYHVPIECKGEQLVRFIMKHQL